MLVYNRSEYLIHVAVLVPTSSFIKEAYFCTLINLSGTNIMLMFLRNYLPYQGASLAGWVTGAVRQHTEGSLDVLYTDIAHCS